jgi:hypothetical protein
MRCVVRLKQIKKILENTDINSLRLGIEVAGPSSYKVTDINGFKKSIADIEQLEGFQPQIVAIKNTVLYEYTSDALTVGTDLKDSLIRLSTHLYYSAKALLDVLSNMYKIDGEMSISIKLPDISDLKELKDTIETLDKIFNQSIINEDIDGNIRVENFDNGTLWIDVFVGSLKAVTVISSIAWSAAVICKKYQEVRIFKEYVESLKIKTESMKDLLSAQKEMTKALIEAEAINIYDKNYDKTNKNEQVSRLAYAITTLAELMQKGAEIHPSLNAPETIGNLFPDMSKLDQIQSQIKQIEQKPQ